ncbi:MAG: hypothetical protein AAB071_03255 [Bacteroidota bacterium]
MTQEEILEELETIIKHQNIHLRYEKGDFSGGYCILKQQRTIIINKKFSLPKKLSILARGLMEIGIEDTFIRPAVREFIEDEIAKLNTK